MEAFSDGVLAIIITIMVLELRAPSGHSFSDLHSLIPTFTTYLLSFIYLGIYWNNHHHLLRATRSVSGGILWANLHLLFWLSLLPFFTQWMGESKYSTVPTFLYGCDLFAASIAYFLLQRVILLNQKDDVALRVAIGRDAKGLTSTILYLLGIVLTAVSVWISISIFIAVAIIWIVPDRRLERYLSTRDSQIYVAKD